MDQSLSVREEKRQKRLEEEARKEGRLAPLKDERGHEINPHMPNFLSNVPFYIDPNQKPSLSHQRQTTSHFDSISTQQYYQRGLKQEKVTKFRKGACENCGAMTHKVKDCFERPRKLKAKFTQQNMQSDEVY